MIQLPDHVAPRECARCAFTMLELIVTIAVIAVLVAVSSPALFAVRGGARSVVCTANLRAFGQAIHMYREDHDGALPYADRLYHIGLGWTDPIDALTPYLDGAALPHVDDQGVIHTGAPFRCPADPDIADETGMSYGYGPSQFMPSLTAFPFITEDVAVKLTTIHMYDNPPRTLWVFLDRDGWHPRSGPDDVSRKNALRFDGAVRRASLSDILPGP